ncbi:hypothetical protein A5706_22190 [Mycobacterium sp. E796]|nr:hypothetical protein A5706_22190 [Mycobacterium sp. E796]
MTFESAEGHCGRLDAPNLGIWNNFGAKQVALWCPVRVGGEKLRVFGQRGNESFEVLGNGTEAGSSASCPPPPSTFG